MFTLCVFTLYVFTCKLLFMFVMMGCVLSIFSFFYNSIVHAELCFFSLFIPTVKFPTLTQNEGWKFFPPDIT